MPKAKETKRKEPAEGDDSSQGEIPMEPSPEFIPAQVKPSTVPRKRKGGPGPTAPHILMGPVPDLTQLLQGLGNRGPPGSNALQPMLPSSMWPHSSVPEPAAAQRDDSSQEIRLSPIQQQQQLGGPQPQQQVAYQVTPSGPPQSSSGMFVNPQGQIDLLKLAQPRTTNA